MSEGAEVNDDGFAEAIAGLVDRHPAIYYRVELEDSHIPFHVVERDFFGDTFLEVFRQYNNALFDSVRLMIRYEKSLKAWREIVAGVDDKVLRDTLVMDYVHPVKLLCMSTLSFRLRFQPGIVFFQEPNVHQAAGLSVAYPLESDVEGLPRFRQGNAQSLSCGAQILPRRPFDFERVAQRPERLAGDVALEAPDGLLLGFSVALALPDVILGPPIIRHPGHRDLVKRPVGAPVAPSVQAMAFRFARARQQRGDAA